MSLSDYIGQTLGQYRIEVPIDAGGMGQVYRGVHIYLNRPAAIKVMRAHLLANPSFRERFLQEARSAAALKHQNIVDIYEFGEQDGQLYLVMELVPDGSLRSLMYKRAKQPWPLSLGLDLMRQAAEGLASAHAQGVIHRDIKPDNMLLLRVNSSDTAALRYRLKISDFGLARLAEGSGLTATGMPLGTLAYMSPEQCLGNNVDGRTDIYALGVVLYEIATGYLPFQIESFEDALRKHTGAMPTPPSQVRPDVPPALERIILRCLAKKPQDRYQTGAELARDLQTLIQSAEVQTIEASAPSLPYENKTALRAPGQTPAPLVGTLQGYSAQPRVRVLDQSGQTVQVAEITQQGVIIGRQAGNTIVLPSDEISRQHVQVRLERGQVTITDLGSSNGTILNERRLQPHTSQVWQDQHMIHVGPYWLRLEGMTAAADVTIARPAQPSAPPTGLVEANYTRQAPASIAYTSSGGRIGIKAEPVNLTLTPGQPSNVRVTLTNLGPLVDWLTVTTEGVPPAWVRGPVGEVQLNPGSQETVDLALNVARSPENRAQDYPVVIRARSREKPNESGTVQTRWTVLPFSENTLRVEPRRASGRGKATYTLAVANNGNIAAEHAFSGEDDEQKIAYQFQQETLAIEPGKEARVPFTVAGQRRFIGKEINQRFQIHSQVKGKTALASNAEFVNKALIPPWVLGAVCAALVVGLILASMVAILMKPTPKTTVITTNPNNSGSPFNPMSVMTPSTVTPPPSGMPPTKLTPTVMPTATIPPMQTMQPPSSQLISTDPFIQVATAQNINKTYTVINAAATNKNPKAIVFATPNITPNGGNAHFNPHPTGVWYENGNCGVLNEDGATLAPNNAFNVWVPQDTNMTYVHQVTADNTSGSGSNLDITQLIDEPNFIILAEQNWNPNNGTGVYDPHPIGITYGAGSWFVFNEDGTTMPQGTSFNLQVLTPSDTAFMATGDNTHLRNGAVILDNDMIDGDPNAIVLVTQYFDPDNGIGQYNPHPVGVAYNGSHWEIVNTDQTPIPAGAVFDVYIAQQ